MLQFKVLGPLEVLDENGALKISAPKHRSVLGALLVHANRVVSLDRLVDQLWSGDPPPQAAAGIQVHISHLRRVLEPYRSPRSPARVLVSKPRGYMLVVDPDHFDAACFEATSAHGCLGHDP